MSYENRQSNAPFRPQSDGTYPDNAALAEPIPQGWFKKDHLMLLRQRVDRLFDLALTVQSTGVEALTMEQMQSAREAFKTHLSDISSENTGQLAGEAIRSALFFARGEMLRHYPQAEDSIRTTFHQAEKTIFANLRVPNAGAGCWERSR